MFWGEFWDGLQWGKTCFALCSIWKALVFMILRWESMNCHKLALGKHVFSFFRWQNIHFRKLSMVKH